MTAPRPRLEDAAIYTLTLRARPSELKRLSQVVASSGRRQSDLLRAALLEVLDRHEAKFSA